MRDLHYVYMSLEINNSNNDLQEEAEHSDLFLFPLEQPKVEAQPTIGEWQMVEEQAPVMQYLTQFLKIFKDAIPHLQEAVDPDLDHDHDHDHNHNLLRFLHMSSSFHPLFTCYLFYRHSADMFHSFLLSLTLVLPYVLLLVLSLVSSLT